MANLPSDLLYVQTESVQTRAPVSENLEQTMGGTINWLADHRTKVIDFRMNGIYANFAGTIAFDGFFIFEKAAEITYIAMYNKTPGSGGNTEVDILYSSGPGGPFTSIFSQKPSISSAAIPSAWVTTNVALGSCVQPILSTAPFPVAANSGIRFDVVTTQTGTPENVGIWVHYREV